VNGHNWVVCNQTLLDTLGYGTQCDEACTFSNIEIEPDKTYLFSFIAATIDTFAGIAIQEHNMTIVQVDGGSWIETYDTNYLEMHSPQWYAAAGPGGNAAGAPPPAPIPPSDLYAIITYTYPGAPSIDSSVYNSAPSADEEMPFLPDFTIGPTYGLISDTFKPINPVVHPAADQQIFLTTSQDSWGGKERHNMNGLALFPDPSFVPLLVGMYNGEIVDDAAIARAEANNGFDNKTGAIVIGRNKTIDFVIKNQIGDLGISVPHPVRTLHSL